MVDDSEDGQRVGADLVGDHMLADQTAPHALSETWLVWAKFWVVEEFVDGPLDLSAISVTLAHTPMAKRVTQACPDISPCGNGDDKPRA